MKRSAIVRTADIAKYSNNPCCDKDTRLILNGLCVTKSELIRVMDRNFDRTVMHTLEVFEQEETGHAPRWTYFSITSNNAQSNQIRRAS